MVALRTHMRERFADWQNNLPPNSGWPAFFEGCSEPSFAAIPEDREIENNAPIWPGRRGGNLQRAPNGAHICRAFDGIEPEDVRVVVLGQDPYPSIAMATGRSFEDGAWIAGGRPEELAASLKPLMLAAWATQPNHAEDFRPRGWSDLIQRQGFALPRPEVYFDTLVRGGVLFVNAAWTHTRSRDVGVHLNVWKPVMRHLLRRLAWRDSSRPIVFLLLGGDARDLFLSTVGGHFRQDVLNRATRLATVYSDHPAYQGGVPYFAHGNPMTRVNQALLHLGSEAVQWWPAQQAEAEEPA